MAPRLPMPRITLKRRPSSRNDSPGLSSVPASIEPIITLSAPAASALTTSPEYLTPPSAITGTSAAPCTPSRIAVIWGIPTPVTTRVVQIEPGPTPTFTASTPRSTSALAPSVVATLPPTSCASGNASRRHATVLSTPSEWPCAESTTSTSQPASTSARARDRASGVPPTAAATRRRPCWSLLASGCRRRLKMSLMVMRPFRMPCASTTGSFSMRCCARIRSASSRVVPTGAVTSRSLVIASRIGRSSSRSNWRSRLVMIPTSRPASSTIGTPEMRNRSISRTASRTGRSGPRVMGWRIIHDSLRLTRSTSAAWRSIGMFLWITPIPPSRAMAIAISASVTVSMAAATSGMLRGMPRVKRERTSTLRGCIVECRGTRRTSSKVRAGLGRKVPMAKVTGRAAVPQPCPCLRSSSAPPPPPPCPPPPRARAASPPSPPRPSSPCCCSPERGRRAACPPASPPPSGTAPRRRDARRTSTRETRRSRARDRPCRRAASRACATAARAGFRSWLGGGLEAGEVDDRVAEEPAPPRPHPRRDLDDGEGGERLEGHSFRLGDDHVHEAALGERPAGQHVRRPGGDLGPQLVRLLQRDELERPADQLPHVAGRIGAQLGGGHAHQHAGGRAVEVGGLHPALELDARPLPRAPQHAQRRRRRQGARGGTFGRAVQHRAAGGFEARGVHRVRGREAGIGWVNPGPWARGRSTRTGVRARARHLRQRLDVALLHPARARHMDPPVRRGFGHAVQEEALRQLADEGTRRRGAEVLFRRARDGEVVSGARRGSDGRREDPPLERDALPVTLLVAP